MAWQRNPETRDPNTETLVFPCVSGFEFRVSGFGFQVSGFGFRFLDFGFRVLDVEKGRSLPGRDAWPCRTCRPAMQEENNRQRTNLHATHLEQESSGGNSVRPERIFMELMTLDRKRKASREGSK
jgi:hypothetical protein